MQMLIPFGNSDQAIQMALRMSFITVANGEPLGPILAQVWKNNKDVAYISIDAAAVITVHPDKKLDPIINCYETLISSGVVTSSAVQSLALLSSDVPVSVTLGQLFIDDLIKLYKVPADLLSKGFRPVPLNSTMLTLSDTLSSIEYQLKKITVGKMINDYAAAIIGSKNVELEKATAEVQQIMTTFGVIKSCFEVGALGTGRDIVISMRPAFPEYDYAFEYVLKAIAEFEATYGAIT